MKLHWDYSNLLATKLTLTARVAQYTESGVQMTEAKEISVSVDLTRSYHEQVMQYIVTELLTE